MALLRLLQTVPCGFAARLGDGPFGRAQHTRHEVMAEFGMGLGGEDVITLGEAGIPAIGGRAQQLAALGQFGNGILVEHIHRQTVTRGRHPGALAVIERLFDPDVIPLGDFSTLPPKASAMA